MFGPPLHTQVIRHSPPNPTMPTSVVHDLLIHDLDLVSRLGSGDLVTNPALLLPAGSKSESADVTGWAGDMGFNLSASRLDQRKIRDIRVVTATALLEADLLRRTMTVYRHVAHGLSVGNGYQAQTLVDIPFVRQEGEPLALQWAAFLDAVADPSLRDLRGIVDVHSVAATIDAAGQPASAVSVTIPVFPGGSWRRAGRRAS